MWHSPPAIRPTRLRVRRPGIGSALHASHATKCYVFGGFLEILASRGFPRKLMMGNDFDGNCPDLASPARSWRNPITNKGFAVFLPIELMLSKGGSYLLRFATCLLRFLLRISYVSATFPATYQLRVGYKAAGPAPFWHQRMRLVHVRSGDDGRARTASCQINPG